MTLIKNLMFVFLENRDRQQKIGNATINKQGKTS